MRRRLKSKRVRLETNPIVGNLGEPGSVPRRRRKSKPVAKARRKPMRTLKRVTL